MISYIKKFLKIKNILHSATLLNLYHQPKKY